MTKTTDNWGKLKAAIQNRISNVENDKILYAENHAYEDVLKLMEELAPSAPKSSERLATSSVTLLGSSAEDRSVGMRSTYYELKIGIDRTQFMEDFSVVDRANVKSSFKEFLENTLEFEMPVGVSFDFETLEGDDQCIDSACPECRGHGYTVETDDDGSIKTPKCHNCEGSGQLRRSTK